MTIRHIRSTLCYTILTGALLTAESAHALRCGRYVISEGDLKLEVSRQCGHPVSVEEWEEYGYYRYFDPKLGDYVHQRYGKPVRMEEWLYNFGPRRLMQKLTFRDGELIKIESLGYGY